MADRCLVAGEEAADVGEKEAMVGGLTSSLVLPGPDSDARTGDEVISVIQGVSDYLVSMGVPERVENLQ